MSKTVTHFILLILLASAGSSVFAQNAGDFRTRDSGDWSNPQVWETFNGSAWVNTATPPLGSETITVVATDTRQDSVFVDVATTVLGTLVNQGIVETDSLLSVGDGGTYEHARDAGKISEIIWESGSTLLMSGVAAEAPADRGQNYHHIIFNTPGLLANLNMNLVDNTIGGDITVIDSGFGRWYLTTAVANEGSTVTIMGDVIIQGGAFSVQGTSNVNTTFVVEHYGDVVVTGGNFSVSRGSQGLGTTTWTLYEGDFSMDNATTQSSTATQEGAAFVFAKQGTQTLTLGVNNTYSALPIEVASGTTLEMGGSILAGAGHFRLREGGAIATTVPGGPDAVFDAVAAAVSLEDNSSYIFNGAEAQVTSDLMPMVVADLTIDNAAGVTLSQETTINGTLFLNAGVFNNTIPFTLGPNGAIAENGGSLAVAVSNESAGDELPTTFHMEQNYPNPFNPSTVIEYGLPVSAEVSVAVYNLLGQEVDRFELGHQSAGVHSFTYRAGALTSGMYIYRLETGVKTVTRTMMLLR